MVGALQNTGSVSFGSMLLKLNSEKKAMLHVFPYGSDALPYPEDAFVLVHEDDKGKATQGLIGRAPWVAEVSRTMPDLDAGPLSQSPALKVEMWRDKIIEGFDKGLSILTGDNRPVFKWDPQGPFLNATQMFSVYRLTQDFNKLLFESAAARWPWSALSDNVPSHEGIVLVPPMPKENSGPWYVRLLDKLFLRDGNLVY